MAISHKARVVAQYLVPIAILYTAAGFFLFKGKVPTLSAMLPYMGGMAGLVVMMTLAQDLVPKSFKESIIFWRISNRLPGHRAFTRRFTDESRYDHKKISNWDDLERMSPPIQQQTFYKLYRRHEKDIRVSHNSFRYLAWRDSASSLILLAFVTVPALGSFSSYETTGPASRLALFALFASIVCAIAARQAADELVYQVLASETQGKRHGVK